MKKKKVIEFFFGYTSSEDERVTGLQKEIFAELAILLLTVAFIDLIIRGVILNAPFNEWSMSLGFTILFTIYFTIRQVSLGILQPEVETKEELKSKLFEVSVAIFGGLAFAS